MNYEEIAPTLNTGDVVLFGFGGKGPISNTIKRFTFSMWSHVGMVLRSEDIGLNLMIESTTLSNVRDIDSGDFREGVQVVSLIDRLNLYTGDVGFRRMENVARTREMIAVIVGLRREFRGREYEQSKLELIRSVYDGPFGSNVEDLSSLFCSELVAEMWQSIGWLPQDPPSNEYNPANFAGDGNENVDDLLLPHVTGRLSDIILIN